MESDFSMRMKEFAMLTLTHIRRAIGKYLELLMVVLLGLLLQLELLRLYMVLMLLLIALGQLVIMVLY